MLDDCVRRYLGGLAKATAQNREYIISDFFEFVGVNPTTAVEWQRSNPLDYRFVDLIYKWVEQGNLRVSSMRTKASCVRGFFLANRVPLPKDRHRFHSDKVPVIGELTLDEFRKVVISCNPTYRAAFMVMFQSGSGVGELIYVNENLAGHVWDEVRRGSRIIRLNLPGRKRNRNVTPYYSFVGFDAVEVLKSLFRSKGWKRDSVLFRTERGDPVTSQSLQSYFRRHAVKLGLIEAETPRCLECGGETVKQRRQEGERDLTFYVCLSCGLAKAAHEYKISQSQYTSIRYRMRTHELRDLFSTEWGRAQAYFGVTGFAGEFFMGHEIDPLKYKKIMNDKSFGLEQYRKAMPMFNILSEDPRKISRSEVHTQLEASEAKVELLGREVAELRRKVELSDEAMELISDPEVIAYLKKKLKKE